jgi:3-oxoacyl-[acyl-carrier-protein] synthase II
MKDSRRKMGSGKRVAVVGMGLRSPVGNSLTEFAESLKTGRSGIQRMPEWESVRRLRTKVAGVCNIDGEEKGIPRNFRRSMGRVSVLAALSAIDAVRQSGLGEEEIASAECGISYGSTAGSTLEQVELISRYILNSDLTGALASSYLKCMSHTCAGNLSTLFRLRGPFIASCTACVSGSQGIGFGYEAIRTGKAEIMITGGAEEMHFLHAAVFDLMLATSSRYNDHPTKTPRPFDAERDGLVVSEGAGTLVLEEYDHAKSRGAHILAEVEGFWTNGSGVHLTDSDAQSIERCMRRALREAQRNPEDIQHVNAHATATSNGDEAEAVAIHRVYGSRVSVAAIKGYTGHTLGASGAIEAIGTILMMRDGFIAPTLNLERPDPQLPPLNHVMGNPMDKRITVAVNNNFAFGGINTSMILSLA